MVLEQLLPNAPAEQDPTDPYPIGTGDGDNNGTDHDPGTVVDNPSGTETGGDHDPGNTTDNPFPTDPTDPTDPSDDFDDLNFDGE